MIKLKSLLKEDKVNQIIKLLNRYKTTKSFKFKSLNIYI